MDSSIDPAELKEAFAHFDKNGDGHVTPAEMLHMLRQLGQNPTETELQELIASADANENGTLELEEF